MCTRDQDRHFAESVREMQAVVKNLLDGNTSHESAKVKEYIRTHALYPLQCGRMQSTTHGCWMVGAIYRWVSLFLEGLKLITAVATEPGGTHSHDQQAVNFSDQRVCAYLRPVFGLSILVGMNSSRFGVHNHEQ